MEVDKLIFNEREKAGLYIFSMQKNIKADKTKLIGKFNKFNILLKEGFFSNDKELTLRGNMSYSISISDSPHGNMVKLENILKGFEKEVEKSKKYR